MINKQLRNNIDLVNKKFKFLVEIQKIKSNIKYQKKILNNLYKKLGKTACVLLYNSDNKVNKLINDINKELDSISLLEKKLYSIIKKNNNPNKNFKNNDVILAKKHIKPAKAPETLKNEQGYSIYKFCKKCQVGNNPDAEICIYCGKNFDN